MSADMSADTSTDALGIIILLNNVICRKIQIASRMTTKRKLSFQSSLSRPAPASKKISVIFLNQTSYLRRAVKIKTTS